MKIIPVRRDVKINLDESRINNWHEAGEHVTHFFNALSVLFPAGERLFMDSVRAYKDQVTDPDLKKPLLHSSAKKRCTAASMRNTTR